MNFNNFMMEFIGNWFNNRKSTNKITKPKRKYNKRVYSEKDCEVSYDPTWLYKMNLPYAEYVDFIEV